MKLFLRCMGIAIGLIFIYSIQLSSQTAKTFWFVAPDATSGHGDSPLFLRLTNVSETNQAANVTITMPKYSGFTYRIVDPNNSKTKFGTDAIIIPAGKQISIELNKDDVENRYNLTSNNKGILIQSSQDINAYYEINHGNNPDKFTLKGESALGTEFLIPSQTQYYNHNTDPDATEKVDIVATEDGTVVTIKPTSDCIDHPKGKVITVNLNKGETYSLVSAQLDGYQNGTTLKTTLSGTSVTSNKNIAVTISDDSIQQYGKKSNGDDIGNYDIIGDQLIPTSVLGKEYIAIKTNKGTDGNIQKVYILATENSTIVKYGLVTDTLNKGQSIEADIMLNSLYINATNPIYVYQVTGYGYEMGSAILPSITCTGSKSVSIKRNLTGAFWVQIMVKTINKDKFTLYDVSDNDVTSTYLKNPKNPLVWNEVMGTTPANEWVTAIIDLSKGNYFSIDNPYTLANSGGKFHLSILDENGASLSYGYFSAYNSIRVSGPSQECVGTDIVLSTTADPAKYYLNWYKSPDMTKVLSTVTKLTTSTSGKYVLVAKEKDIFGCENTASLNVDFFGADYSLPKDTDICSNANITLTGPVGTPPYKYLWEYKTGTTTSTATTKDLTLSLTTGTKTEVKLTVTDDNQCAVKDTMIVNTYSVPALNLTSNSTSICIGQKIGTTTEMASYQWYLNGTLLKDSVRNEIYPQTSGKYTLTGWTENNCSTTEDLTITVNPLPVINLQDLTGCNGSSQVFSGPAGMKSYLWHDKSTSNQITINAPTDKIKLTVTDNNGCSNRDSASYAWWDAIPVLGDRLICPSSPITLASDVSFTNYKWTFKQTSATTTVTKTPDAGKPNQLTITSAAIGTHDGIYYITATDVHSCPVNQQIKLTVETIPALDLGDETKVRCIGSPIVLKSDNVFDKYEWTKDADATIISKENHTIATNNGIYHLTVTSGTGLCKQSGSITVTTAPSPTITLSDFKTPECLNIPVTVTANATGGNAPFTYKWLDKDKKEIANATSSSLERTDAGTFNVVITDSKGCTDTAIAVINRYPLTTFQLSNIDICDNRTTTLALPATLATAKSYTWHTADNSASGETNKSWTVSNEGTYVLDILDANGCPASSSLTLFHKASPIFDLGDAKQDRCDGETIAVAPQSTYGNYYWNGSTAAGQPSSYTIVGNNLVQTISLRITSAINDCESEKSIQVSTHSIPVVDLGDDISVCAGIQSTLSAPQSATTVLWTTPKGTTTEKTITVDAGLHKLEVTDAYGCKNKDEINIEWRPLPVVDLGPDEIICPLDQLIIDAGSGDAYAGSYQSFYWEPSKEITQTIVAMADTVNLVGVVASNGCKGWDSKVVYIQESPEYKLGNDTSICSNDTLLLDADPELLYTSYLWSDNATTQIDSITAPGDYWAEVSDGCFILRDTINVAFYPTPVIAQVDTTIYQQIAILSSGGTEPYMYSINEGELQEENRFRDLENGTYILYVEDTNGCNATDTVTIFTTLDIEVPNFVTPNGDGQNDKWEISGLSKFPETNIRIYDRYGKLLRLYKPTDEAWDGMYMNKPVASDDYWYVIELIPGNKLLKGHITLKR